MDSRLESVKLPDGLAEIGEWAFDGSLIRCINMPGTVVSVGRGAFRFCLNLEDVKLSTGLENLPAQLFSRCPKLKVLDVPSNVRSVCYSAMAWCDGLEVLKLHDGIEEIVDEGPMLGVIGNLRHVNLPATLRKVPGGVFNYSPYINVFNLDSANPFFRIIEDALCSKDGKRLYSVPGYNRTVYNVPDGIEVIEERAFAFLPELRSVKLSSTLKVIKSRAFQGCGSLNYMEIPAGVEWIDIDALWADNLKTIVMDGAEPPRMTGHLKDEDYRYQDVDLYVPCEAVWEYRSAPGWKCFAVKGRKDG